MCGKQDVKLNIAVHVRKWGVPFSNIRKKEAQTQET